MEIMIDKSHHRRHLYSRTTPMEFHLYRNINGMYLLQLLVSIYFQENIQYIWYIRYIHKTWIILTGCTFWGSPIKTFPQFQPKQFFTKDKLMCFPIPRKHLVCPSIVLYKFTNIQIYKYKCGSLFQGNTLLVFHCSKLVWKLWLRQTKSRQAWSKIGQDWSQSW